MSPLALECKNLVQAAGGRLAYRELYAQIAPENRLRLANALKEARKEGALDQDVKMVEGVVVQTLFIP